jgi:hypothetical protein
MQSPHWYRWPWQATGTHAALPVDEDELPVVVLPELLVEAAPPVPLLFDDVPAPPVPVFVVAPAPPVFDDMLPVEAPPTSPPVELVELLPALLPHPAGMDAARAAASSA